MQIYEKPIFGFLGRNILLQTYINLCLLIIFNWALIFSLGSRSHQLWSRLYSISAFNPIVPVKLGFTLRPRVTIYLWPPLAVFGNFKVIWISVKGDEYFDYKIHMEKVYWISCCLKILEFMRCSGVLGK